MNGEGLDGEEIEKMLSLHPLTVFSKLVDENPESKLYQQCLENEISKAADSIIENMGEEQIAFFEGIISLVPDNFGDDDKEIAMKLRVIKRIFEAVHRKKDAKV